MNIHDACEEAYKRGYEKGRAEAIKEFAERVKAAFGDEFCCIECYFYGLDELAKEMGVEL